MSITVLAAAFCCALAGPIRAGDPASPNAGEWPQRLGERRLYRCENGLIYAKDKSTAGQARRMLGTAVKDAQEDGATGPAAGLVIVMDIREKLPFDIVKLLEATGKAETPEANEKSEEALKALAEAREKLEKEGLDLDTLLSIVPLPLPPSMLNQVAQGFPEDAGQQIAWCVVMPTSKRIKAGFKKILDAGMKKQKPGLVERATLAAMMPIIERKVVAQMKKAQQATLYESLVETRSDLSNEEKARKIEAYKKKLGLDGEFKITDKEEPSTEEEDE